MQNLEKCVKCVKCSLEGRDAEAITKAYWIDHRGCRSHDRYWVCEECLNARPEGGGHYIEGLSWTVVETKDGGLFLYACSDDGAEICQYVAGYTTRYDDLRAAIEMLRRGEMPQGGALNPQELWDEWRDAPRPDGSRIVATEEGRVSLLEVGPEGRKAFYPELED